MINLIEVDFNYANEVIVREILRYAKENQLLPREQYESKREYKVINQAINKRLLYDLNQLCYQSIIIYNKDAKSCYN